MITFKNTGHAGTKFSSMDVTFDECIASERPGDFATNLGVSFEITQGRRVMVACILNEMQIRKLHEQLGDVLMNHGTADDVQEEPVIVGESIEETD